MSAAAALLAALSCVLLGVRASGNYALRVSVLEELTAMTVEMRTRMEYSHACLCELLRQLSRQSTLSHLTFLDGCASRCDSGEPFPSAWDGAVDDFEATVPLHGSDIKVLRAMGDFAGITDIAGQLEFLRLSESMLCERAQDARQAQQKYGKVCVTLGVSAAAAVCLIFL